MKRKNKIRQLFNSADSSANGFLYYGRGAGSTLQGTLPENVKGFRVLVSDTEFAE